MKNLFNKIKYFFWSLKDTTFNISLNVWNFVLYNIFKTKNKDFTILSGYELSYFDDFTKLSIKDINLKYNLTQTWMPYLPSDMNQWYDPAGTTIDKEGLKLSVTQNTLNVTTYEINGILSYKQPIINIPHGIGTVTSKKAFQYGIYEWNIKLPKGPQLWPAIWLTGRDSWPGEIDINESYSDNSGNYGRNLNSNIHCGSNPENHYSIGANRHGLFVDVDKTLNLILHWSTDFIKIYYNGFLCKILTNPKDLAWFNNDPNMLVIMNTGLRTNNKDIINATPLIIYNFKYFSMH